MPAQTARDFYRGKTVLVTGHTGFKGGWLAYWLHMLGARVIGFSLPPPDGEPSFFTAVQLERKISSLTGDIRNALEVRRLFSESEPDLVFHLAAQAIVRKSYRDPLETYATNVMGTAYILDALRHSPSVGAAVIVTSDKCYLNKEWPYGYREVDPMGGHDPYSSSKGCAELVTAAFRNSYLTSPDAARVASARAGNVIGGGDWAEDRIVPDCIRSLAAHEPIVLRNPDAIRPWQHVLDPLWGYLLLGQRLLGGGHRFAQGWNFGPSEHHHITVRELAELIKHEWGHGEIREVPPSDAPHEAHFLKLDCGQARSQLGWRPRIDLETAVRMTVAWYRTYLETPERIDNLTESQIADFPSGVD